jgi:hypothetical protein
MSVSRIKKIADPNRKQISLFVDEPIYFRIKKLAHRLEIDKLGDIKEKLIIIGLEELEKQSGEK